MQQGKDCKRKEEELGVSRGRAQVYQHGGTLLQTPRAQGQRRHSRHWKAQGGQRGAAAALGGVGIEGCVEELRMEERVARLQHAG